ncbi:hypothetical protein Tco_1241575 [Tanacetum coccineum]
MLDSRGFITLITLTQALISIQVMAYHSHNWYDETTTKEKINDNPNNVDAIQESFKEAHLTKECPLKKEDKEVKQREKFKARTTMGKENIKEPVPRNLPPTPFLGHLKEQIGSPYITRETVCMIENPGEVLKLKAQEDEGDMDVMQPYMSLGPVHDKEKVVREEEQDYDIPLHDGVTQPFQKECSDITRVAKMADGNPVKDIKELSDIIKTSDFETFILKLLHQVPAARRQILRPSRPVIVW